MNVMDPTEVFRQEASELFDVLEGALLDLGQRPDDRELVDSAFRALHTIRRDAVVANRRSVALVVGALSAQQIEEDWNSLQAKIPPAFLGDLKSEGLIEAGTPLCPRCRTIRFSAIAHRKVVASLRRRNAIFQKLVNSRSLPPIGRGRS
jgi:hypothetical protein